MKHVENDIGSPEGPENPEIPAQMGVLARLKKTVRAVGSYLYTALNGDPEKWALVEKTLTPEFVGAFYAEYSRMLKESKEDALRVVTVDGDDHHAAPTVWQRVARSFEVNGWGHQEKIFTAVYTDMVPTDVRNLPQPYLSHVVTKLRGTCGLFTA
jgi:hypothetical protein